MPAASSRGASAARSRLRGPLLAALLAACGEAGPAAAEGTVLAARTIRAQSVITAADVALDPVRIAGAYGAIADVVGLEARTNLYAGRPIRLGDLGPPAVIERNATVLLTYRAGPLAITAEGRALARAGVGEMVRVMNLASRSTVTGRVAADGTVAVAAETPAGSSSP
jgi:flagella basal body P-ring formation protein FlgA